MLWLGACADTDSAPEVVRAEQTGTSAPPPVDTSDPSASSTPISEIEMCELLTLDEIEAALDRTVNEGVPDNYDEETFFCEWAVTVPPPSPDQSEDMVTSVSLSPTEPGDQARFDELTADPESIIVPGLGDFAVVENDVVPGPMYVVLGDHYLEMEIHNFSTPADFAGDDAIVEALVQLATLAVSRLPDLGDAAEPTDPPPSEPAEAAGICGLLTQEEVENALARTVEPGVEDSFDREVARCTWTVTMPPPDPELSDDLKATVMLVPMTDIDRAELDALAANPENIVIPGLGDLAVINAQLVPGPMYVVVGDEYLEVDLANFRTPADFPNEERIIEILTELSTLAFLRL